MCRHEYEPVPVIFFFFSLVLRPNKTSVLSYLREIYTIFVSWYSKY